MPTKSRNRAVAAVAIGVFLIAAIVAWMQYQRGRDTDALIAELSAKQTQGEAAFKALDDSCTMAIKNNVDRPSFATVVSEVRDARYAVTTGLLDENEYAYPNLSAWKLGDGFKLPYRVSTATAPPRYVYCLIDKQRIVRGVGVWDEVPDILRSCDPAILGVDRGDSCL
jgi:hypothetical protein